jgi:hypothetical protein
MIQNLSDVGYEHGKNLVAAPVRIIIFETNRIFSTIGGCHRINWKNEMDFLRD